ncbi:MAG TPA: Uma2 family endonuclease [Gemmatimonadaceae bacterium]
MPAIEQRRWTYEEVEALIDDQEDRSIRYEYADGELLVTPSPSGYHQRIILDLFRLIDSYVREHSLGEVRLGPSPVHVLPRTIFQPDLHVVPSANGRRPRADIPVTSSLLIVEVLSPGSRRHDRLTKRRQYQRGGVPEYWIIDQDGDVVERWRPGDDRPEVLDGTLSWHPDGAPEPLAIDLPLLFRTVRDDPPA